MEKWEQSKITIPISEDCLEELKIAIWNYSEFDDYWKCLKNIEENIIDITELADRIIIEENPLNICIACNNLGIYHCSHPEECGAIKIGQVAKLLPIKQQSTIDPSDMNLVDMEDVKYNIDSNNQVYIIYDRKIYGIWNNEANIDYPENLIIGRDLNELIDIGIQIGIQMYKFNLTRK